MINDNDLIRCSIFMVLMAIWMMVFVILLKVDYIRDNMIIEQGKTKEIELINLQGTQIDYL